MKKRKTSPSIIDDDGKPIKDPRNPDKGKCPKPKPLPIPVPPKKTTQW